MSTSRSAQRCIAHYKPRVIRPRTTFRTIIPSVAHRSLTSHATQKSTGRGRMNQSASDIFEPFLDSINNKTEPEPVQTLAEMLARVAVKDLFPSDEQLETFIKKKYIGIPIENQKKIVSIILENLKADKELTDEQSKEIIALAEKPSELAALGNIILRSSKFGAPIGLALYKCSMTQGDDRGAFSYANMLYRGYNGTPKDEMKAIEIMSKLAQKGHPYAQMNLAAILMRTQPDKVESAIKLYSLAAKGGLDSAYMELGRMYRLGYGVHQDHNTAIDYFKKGAQAGNPQCNFMLGVYYSSGLGVESKEPDQAKAFKCFQKAALKGLPEAQYNVGLRFLKGHGVESNPFNAAEFFRMAAMQGFQLAQINLAGMYIEGCGVKKDLDEARALLEKAIVKGGAIGKDAQKRLDELDNVKKDSSKCTVM
ncbi:hypothetical protein J3Q64DRAFT_1730004 [Phycomyces blakesleeanus]|uniref:HCP-like protein n=1 Tax=Phycomyces blakesleeanus TaxID=4837 RepID=A0ABR3B6P5_PHYBL